MSKTRKSAHSIDQRKNMFEQSSKQMNEPLDQKVNKAKVPSDGFKQLDTVLLSLSVVIVLFAYLSVWSTEMSMTSPWLPKYTAYYLNGALINYAVIQLGGLIPALFLRVKKHYLISSVCIISFILAASILKNYVKIYEWFY